MILQVLKSPGGVYLDHNATTPLAKSIADKMPDWLVLWGNASSIHMHGRAPKKIVRDVRRSAAMNLNCSPLELVFTSGGSESNNMVIKGLAFDPKRERERNQIIISAVEHPAVKNSAYSLEPFGFEIFEIPVNLNGELDIEQLEDRLSDKTLLVSVMAVNNETGNIFPIEQITKMAHQYGAFMHTDAVQALGRVPLDLAELGVDFASFSAHKFYALKGCGVLFQKKGTNLFNLIDGGAQERRRRAGTENVLAIASFGESLDLLEYREAYDARIKLLRDRFESEMTARFRDISITGSKGPRVSSCSSMIIPDVDGETLLMNLDLKGFSVSTGAACSAGSAQPSPTLLAMGLTRAQAQASLRVSLGWGTTEQEIGQFIECLGHVIDRLRNLRQEAVSV